MNIAISESITKSAFWFSAAPATKVVLLQLMAMADRDGLTRACVGAVARWSDVSMEEAETAIAVLLESRDELESFGGFTFEACECGWRFGGLSCALPDNVYFAQCGTDGPIKIGVSNNPTGRIATLNTANPESIRLLAAIPGGLEAERRLHQRFAADRISNEWFRPSEGLLALIEAYRRKQEDSE